MKKYLSITMIFLSIIMSITACGIKGTQDIVSKALALDVSNGSEVSNYDTHSGNGDGTSCIVFSFNDNVVLKKFRIMKNGKHFLLMKQCRL